MQNKNLPWGEYGSFVELHNNNNYYLSGHCKEIGMLMI